MCESQKSSSCRFMVHHSRFFGEKLSQRCFMCINLSIAFIFQSHLLLLVLLRWNSIQSFRIFYFAVNFIIPAFLQFYFKGKKLLTIFNGKLVLPWDRSLWFCYFWKYRSFWELISLILSQVFLDQCSPLDHNHRVYQQLTDGRRKQRFAHLINRFGLLNLIPFFCDDETDPFISTLS